MSMSDAAIRARGSSYAAQTPNAAAAASALARLVVATAASCTFSRLRSAGMWESLAQLRFGLAPMTPTRSGCSVATLQGSQALRPLSMCCRTTWRASLCHRSGALPRLRRCRMRLRGHGRPLWRQGGDDITDNPSTYEQAEMADAIEHDGLYGGVGGHRPRARDDDV